ncbi:amidohydrolase [Dethiosulfovibrio sp. F2B]|uniref:amidohydrolase n=1 Tax=Dethiosulfovibrio faecalis TaxID=2720018 RepID=UPI001F1EBF1C|nr:amidohydrolase [Dethiosulfovibrio faecalis]MCF4151096.1 amidohydrolase [Dethiosulfovibrio faecalis]
MKAITKVQAWTVTNGIVENATVVVDGGKIVSVQSGGAVPEGAEVIDGTGKILTPGFIDAHVHAGICEEAVPGAMNAVNEDTGAVTPSVRAVDGINPSDEAFRNALSAGITCMQILPGSANIIGGIGAILKPVGHIVDKMVVRAHSGMKAALGENPVNWQGGKGRFPSTRMGNAACMRKAIQDAFDYRDKKKRAEEKGEHFSIDQGMEHFLPVLDRTVPMRIHSHRADDICTAIRICDEFGLRYTIEHCTEGQFIADYLAEKEIRAAVGPTATSKTKEEVRNKGWETLLALKKAGVSFCLITDHPVIPIETLPVAAALAIRAGLDAETALEALTIAPARHLEVDDRMGSIEPGKDADLVLWGGDPFDVRNAPELVLVDGESAL